MRRSAFSARLVFGAERAFDGLRKGIGQSLGRGAAVRAGGLGGRRPAPGRHRRAARAAVMGKDGARGLRLAPGVGGLPPRGC